MSMLDCASWVGHFSKRSKNHCYNLKFHRITATSPFNTLLRPMLDCTWIDDLLWKTEV